MSNRVTSAIRLGGMAIATVVALASETSLSEDCKEGSAHRHPAAPAQIIQRRGKSKTSEPVRRIADGESGRVAQNAGTIE